MNIRVLFASTLIIFIVSACTGNPSTAVSSSQPSEIRDPEIGEVYEELNVQIENTNNCDGMNSTTIFRRSLEQGQTTVFDVVIEAGGLMRGTPIPEILEFELESRLKSALQRANIISDVKSTELPLNTPTGEARKHTIIWREKKVKGIIEVLYQDKVAKIGFQRLIGFQLEDRTSEAIPCNGSHSLGTSQPSEATVPSTETSLPHPTQEPTSPKPQTAIVSVIAAEETGVRFDITTSGLYEISYSGDAYSPWANEQQQDYMGWTTIVRIYKNRPIEWGKTEYGLVGPINQDEYIGPGNYYLDKNQAVEVSKGDRKTLRLNAGDYLILVILDEKGRYSDNRGKVDIGITMVGQ